RLLGNIERATKKKVEEMQLPSTEYINNARISRFKQRITDVLTTEELSFFSQLIEQYQTEHDVPAVEIAAALAMISQGSTPLLLKDIPKRSRSSRQDERGRGRDRADRDRGNKPKRSRDGGRNSDIKMELYRIEVGNSHGVKPGNIVGAIANETGIDGDHIARIKIEENYSTVELPAGMPKELFQELKKVRVAGQQLNISSLDKSLIKKAKSKKRVGSSSRRRKQKPSE
ncbi:MAG: DbpA RNA binding domain-containing protein, partial [Thiotrichaceae bacterium]|nr:DbpA RNA binding domain-containing protein [Thiotrichaceae bacterium]